MFLLCCCQRISVLNQQASRAERAADLVMPIRTKEYEIQLSELQTNYAAIAAVRAVSGDVSMMT
jgi:hypothetical protein